MGLYKARYMLDTLDSDWAPEEKEFKARNDRADWKKAQQIMNDRVRQIERDGGAAWARDLKVFKGTVELEELT